MAHSDGHVLIDIYNDLCYCGKLIDPGQPYHILHNKQYDNA